MREFDLRQDTALAEFVDEGDAFAGEAAEPVEVEDDEDLTAAQNVPSPRSPSGPISPPVP